MQEYLFIFGRNPILSRAELVSFLSSNSIPFSEKYFRDNFAVIETQEVLPKNVISTLGGTVKIGEMTAKGRDIAELEMELDNKMLYDGSEKGFKYGITYYLYNKEIKEFLPEYLKKRFKKEKLKAQYKPHIQDKRLRNSKNIIEFSGMFCSGRYYLFRIKDVFDTELSEKRDIERPNVVPELSIPPRVARIMINLSGAVVGDNLVDPFCGVGTILQEALIIGINAFGVDIEKNRASGAVENLRWIESEFKTTAKYKIIFGTAKKLSLIMKPEFADAVVSEPYLGPALRRRPGLIEAKAIRREVEFLYRDTFSEIYKILKRGKRMVIISPRIVTKERKLSIDMEKIANENHFVVLDHFTDYRPGQKIEREIFVLQKK